MSTSPEYATFHFHALHHADQPLLLPNAWDVISAAALAGAGYAAVGTTSLGVAAAHGYPDGRGLAEVRDATLALALRLNGRLPCPYTVDVEGGFGGGPGQVGDLAAELAEAGAAGLNLEDGLPGGEGLQDPVRQAELISAVKERAPGLFLNARIDTHWLTDSPPPLSAALERAEAYLAAGADGIFVPGVTADEDVSVLVAEIPAPLNILFAPGRHTVSRLAELGVRRISTGSLLFRTALQATLTAADAIRMGQQPTDAAGAGGEVLGYEEVQRLVAGEE
ncbi:isocitrate lyase/phosphoenolpyruvate mutase family protein [Streptomyces decoyicus]|uniref:isocitrate lyase/PEP mutase family protein n=1 Tax=Streptomyces decoyicus TaxID=249567 RepID=UPI002E1734F2|nr:isocitrate lyase/phosphoenolpyruvate mutase family protein [Streptomyces decoyicus]